MAYDTKVMLSLLAHQIAKAESLEEAYFAVTSAANVEGLGLPSYEDLRKEYEKLGKST
ncbi:MAG: hypothetical protein FWE60_00220 [Oscillospiraceae bacterium]|jgi:predicted lipoprotein|nr:hypothetical protein [Oscillospiraceae bacterium]